MIETKATLRPLTKDSVDANEIVDGWDDYESTLALGKGTGPNQPSWEEIGSTGIWQYAFGVADTIQIPAFHFLHTYKMNSVFYPHIHFKPKTAMTDGDQVKLRISFLIQKGHNQGAFQDTPFVIDTEYTSDGVTPIRQHIIAEHPTGVTATLLGTSNLSDLVEPDTLMEAAFSRVAATTQEFSGEIYGLKADMHVMKDRFATKNRTPNFYT